jgi:hypothetical protein
MVNVPPNLLVDDITVEGVEGRPGKARYIPPALKVYGTVVEFTKGSATINDDGINQKHKMSK